MLGEVLSWLNYVTSSLFEASFMLFVIGFIPLQCLTSVEGKYVDFFHAELLS